MTTEASKVVARLEQRIHEVAEAKAEAQVQDVVRAFEELAAVFDGCYRTRGIRLRWMVELKCALIERHSGEMVEALVARLIEPPAAS